ncbi:MAG TPA: hypothetical protein VIL16_32365 [Trebonia sp.]
MTLLLAGIVFHQRLHRREWASASAMTIGLVGLLYFLAPSGRPGAHAQAACCAIGIAANLVVVGGLVAWGRRCGGAQRAAVLGVAAGAAFGMTAALVKAMTSAFTTHGVLAIFTSWQTYAPVRTCSPNASVPHRIDTIGSVAVIPAGRRPAGRR